MGQYKYIRALPKGYTREIIKYIKNQEVLYTFKTSNKHHGKKSHSTLSKIADSKIIVVRFSECTMKIWGGYLTYDTLNRKDYKTNASLVYKTEENYKFLNDFKVENIDFLRKYLRENLDINKLPYYLYTVFNDIYSQMIQELVEGIFMEEFYISVFPKDCVVNTLLQRTMIDIKNIALIQSFISKLQKSLSPCVLCIDKRLTKFYLQLKIEEKIQTGGRAQGKRCSFKKIDSYLAIDNWNGYIFLYSDSPHQTMLIFDIDKDKWGIISYFLYNYYQSECRYKKSYPPIEILSQIGVKNIRKAYKSNDGYMTSDQWFTIYNKKQKLQTSFLRLKQQIFGNIQ